MVFHVTQIYAHLDCVVEAFRWAHPPWHPAGLGGREREGVGGRGWLGGGGWDGLISAPSRRGPELFVATSSRWLADATGVTVTGERA